jgi:tetratricopeptide (TPR) repeat protein
MLPPGLLPEDSEPRRSPQPWVLGAVVLTALLALLGALFQIRRIARERDDALEKLVVGQKKAVEALPRPPEVARPSLVPDQVPAPPAPGPALPPPGPTRAPDVRVLPSRAQDSQHLAQGLHEFRAGRYDQAERQFFRAFPDSLLYLALSSLAQANYREALGFLSRAMTVDPDWLRKVRPADLFGSDAAYRRMLRALQDQSAEDPVNPDLKTLLAYLQYHEKGAPYAKALLIEATNARPDHEAAKTFLEALGP